METLDVKSLFLRQFISRFFNVRLIFRINLNINENLN